MGPEPESVPRGVPGALWEPLGTILGAILGPIWDNFKSIFGVFGNRFSRVKDAWEDNKQTDNRPTDRQTRGVTWTPEGVTHGRQKGSHMDVRRGDTWTPKG